MTVSNTISRGDYVGNGVTTAFTIPFYFLDVTHVKILRTEISTGVITTLTITTDYTITGAGVQVGGTATMLVAPTIDQKISILRSVPLTQLTHYVPNDPFPSASHEQALDELTMIAQQLNEAISRALTFSANTTGLSTTLPTPVAYNLIGFDSSASSLQLYDPAAILPVTGYTATSTSSLTIGTGEKTFVTQASKLFSAGQWLQIAYSENASNYMHGTVTSYSGTSLVMNITNVGGSGTFADWNISVSGSQGTTAISFNSLLSGTNTTSAMVVGTGSALTPTGSGNIQASSLTSTIASQVTFTKSQSGAIVALTDGATITPDFSLGNNFSVQLAGNRTLANPTNITQGQSGQINIYQDSTGSRTLAYAWGWWFPNGTAPTLSTGALVPDELCYDVQLYSSGTVTITIATPAVITWTSHNLRTGSKVQLTTTGALPTGFSASTTYFAIVVDSNNINLATSLANAASGTKIATSGSQSGVHTATSIEIHANLVKAFS